jgi:hypothetical protein
MRRAVFVVAPLALLGVLLAGCGPQRVTAGTASPVPFASHSPAPTAAASVPPQLPAATSANCPFLDLNEVQNDNGQHVGSVKVSTSADGQAHPVCYFYRPDGHLQMTVRVYVGTAAVATALVNQAAPIKTSDPADQPPGWQGGSEASSPPPLAGAVYAIAKGGTAIIVVSNQLQSIKCRLVATAVANGLGG